MIYTVACCVILLIPFSTLSAQNSHKLPDKKARKFLKKFSKRAFIRDIEKERAEYYEMVTRLKKRTNEQGERIFANDKQLKEAYNRTQKAYNRVLDSMIVHIKRTNTIADFYLFDANARYQDELKYAQKLGNDFLKSGEKKLSGETKFIGKIFPWLVKIVPILKKIANIYLEHAKSIMVDRLNMAKYIDWEDI